MLCEMSLYPNKYKAMQIKLWNQLNTANQNGDFAHLLYSSILKLICSDNYLYFLILHRQVVIIESRSFQVF